MDFRADVFENLLFHGGGVHIERDARGQTTFRNCNFHGIDGWSIDTLGPGVVRVHVEGCEFSESDGGAIRIGHSGCDNWIIGDGSAFVRLRGAGVEVRSSGVHIRNAYFESKLDGGLDNPYIRVPVDSFNNDDEGKPRLHRRQLSDQLLPLRR